MTAARFVSRNARRAALDRWLLDNRGRVERESTTAIALELKRDGYYSAKTSTCDARDGVRRRCQHLGVIYPGKMT